MACEALLGVCVGVMEILNLQPMINNHLVELFSEYRGLAHGDMLGLFIRREGA
jgi:hypothetical protein